MDKVEELREIMNKTIEVYGIASKEALIASQNLDPYIYENMNGGKYDS